jgi:hypothetical protein
VCAVVEGPASVFLARSTQALDPAELVGRLTDATGGLRLLDRPSDPRLRNPGPLVAQIMDVLHRRAAGAAGTTGAAVVLK